MNWRCPRPPYPQLSKDVVSQMLQWILHPEAQQPSNGLPLKGELQFDQHLAQELDIPMLGRINSGVYLLTASYQDRGASGMPAIARQERRAFRYPLLTVANIDQLVNGMAMPIPAAMLDGVEAVGLQVAILRTGDSEDKLSYAVFKDIDLSGIAAIRVGVATTKLFTTGGELSLRLDGIDSPSLASVDIENNNLGMPSDLDYYKLPLEGANGYHDVLLVSSQLRDGDGRRPNFILMTIEFIREK